jgi:HAD superfamily hydrolase (TIGR01509 family)
MDAVCFDMDGVVVDSERYWRDREREALLPCAVGEPVPLSEVTGLNVVDLYAHLSDAYGTRVTEAAFLDAYDEAAATVYGSEVRLLPGFEALVGDLRDAGVATALVSSSPVRWIDLVLDRFDLHDAFDAVVSADHAERGKPAPDVYRLATDRLGVSPERTVAVEDSGHGIAAANAAGLTAVGLLGPSNDAGTVADADHVAGDAEALASVLLSRRDA